MDRESIMQAAEERRFWKDVGKIAFQMGKKDVCDAATRRSRALGAWIVAEVELELAAEERGGD